MAEGLNAAEYDGWGHFLARRFSSVGWVVCIGRFSDGRTRGWTDNHNGRRR
jgi:hypothetical protein